jgi:hypothetical protein
MEERRLQRPRAAYAHRVRGLLKRDVLDRVRVRRDDLPALRALADGGLGPALTAVLRPRVLAAWKSVVFVATDDAVVMVPITGAPVVLVTGLPHVVDLVADATGVYFTTAGPPARVWSMPWW